MKKWIIISLSVVVFFLLIVRIFYKEVDDFKTERQWYLKQLDMDFSGHIDSLHTFRNNRGLIHFHLTRGSLDPLKERRLNSQVKHRGMRLIMLGEEKNNLSTFTEQIDKFSPGDSITVNTESDFIKIFRKGKEINTASAAETLSRRPF